MSVSLVRRKVRSREDRRQRRHLRVRKRVHGTAVRPRLVVFRSLKHVEGQLVDDQGHHTLLGVSTRAPELRELRAKDSALKKADVARAAGKLLAERARTKGIERVVFDRAGYQYHGRVKAFADGAREGGLIF
ncbi:MAG: 50S ribosomal protein L18 [Gemmatimonadetes bacterium]|nr:50S ribosomal protein L18 [Gemmatimonadota bacterium]